MKDQTEIAVVADRSGSMASLVNDMIGGFDTFIAEQKKSDTPAFVTLTIFDNVCDTVYTRKPLAEVPSLRECYTARGGTSLNDAVGRTINEVGARLAALPEEDRPNKVIVLILTDGQENSSVEFSGEQIKQMIKTQQEVYNWSFVFIGAGIDAYAMGHAYGLNANAIISGSRGQMKGAYGAVSAYTTRTRAADSDLYTSGSLGFSSLEKVGAGDNLGIGTTDSAVGGTAAVLTEEELKAFLTKVAGTP